MALSPVKALTFAILWAFWVSAMTEATSNPAEIPECHGWDILTGCDSTVSQLFAVLVFGSIPGAPDSINLLFSTVGLLCRIVGVWSIMELVRG